MTVTARKFFKYRSDVGGEFPNLAWVSNNKGCRDVDVPVQAH